MSQERDMERPIPSQSNSWSDTLSEFQHTWVEDKILAKEFQVSMHKDRLQFLLTKVKSGRRVFKQICLKGDMSFLVYADLIEIQETDLAFVLALSKDLWSVVQVLYSSKGVTRWSREMAIKKALKQLRWKEILQMAKSSVSSASICRTAFQEMVRCEKFSVAVEVSKGSVHLTDQDFDLAIRTCLQFDKLDYVIEFVKKLKTFKRHIPLLKQLVEATIHAGKLSCFLDLAKLDTTDELFLKSFFQLLLGLQQDDFVLEFCRVYLEEDWDDSHIGLHAASVAAIETCRWEVVKTLWSLDDFMITPHYFRLYLSKCLNGLEERHQICPLLHNWCSKEAIYEDYSMLELVHEIQPLLSDTDSSLANWCCAEGLHDLGFILSLASNDPANCIRILTDFGSSIKKCVLVECIQAKPHNLDTETVVDILKHLSIDDVDLDYLWAYNSPNTLLEMCQNKGLTEWTIQLGLSEGNWEIVENEMTVHDNICVSLIDDVIVEASSAHIWPLVNILINRCSQTTSFLFRLLSRLIVEGDTEDAIEIAKALLERVDPCLAQQFSYGRTLLQEAVQSSANREKMVTLCITTGVSTHEQSLYNTYQLRSYWNSTYSAMKRVLWNGQFPLVKLLYMSGATSNEELHQLKSDQNLRTRLQGQGRMDIVSYFDHAASTPRKLQDLCRLHVSHLIGCRPGRDDRLESLPLPSIVKDLVRFKDIL
ncbi:hypothetical protein V1264_010534 [Littorina saxatilis]|uniref:SOCS box domain-containing protein n=1 Tax=Littorina saxatilis TaxID=31220 RepID=A0AAN9API9_9CAEN